jgi:hypothetical protein
MQYQGSKMGNETFYTCENSTVPLPLNPRNDVVGWTPLTFIRLSFHMYKMFRFPFWNLGIASMSWIPSGDLHIRNLKEIKLVTISICSHCI